MNLLRDVGLGYTVTQLAQASTIFHFHFHHPAAGCCGDHQPLPLAACLAPPPPKRVLGACDCKPAKKVQDWRQLQLAQPTSTISPVHHCPACLLPSHFRHVCRTASQPQGRVTGTPDHAADSPTGMLTPCVDRGGVRPSRSTSAPARGSKMSSSPTWAPWAPSRCAHALPSLRRFFG